MRVSKSRNKGEAAKLEMTPMIDVVFQLLIFFLVTMKQEDILSQLEVSRPAPESTPPPAQVDELLTITVYEKGYVLKGRNVSLQHLDSQLSRLAGFSTKISVVIKCTAGSPHSNLVKLLDICSKSGLTNLSVFSM
ncbi:MAG: biopolymer transporter ExbD [Kiritimatiellae bacterium]|nr:biopolymer transporter ExbD [Kiritimatiellia bacterium]